ncbi:DUF1435 family protein [Klebsiella aerogenes]|nr:DUF1435 family protein [Klebsiella aerogenes]QIP26429.1 DUF1435 family protein [Klebsiella aerogenes]
MTNDKSYHMILVIIIVVRGETMLQRALGSGWGILLPGVLVMALGMIGLPVEAWRVMIVLGLLLSAAMIWHRQLRHFVLLPSSVALVSGIMLIMLNLKLMG